MIRRFKILIPLLVLLLLVLLVMVCSETSEEFILLNLGLNHEISALQCRLHKGAVYKFLSVRVQNEPLSPAFGRPNFSGAKSGWFGAFLEKTSILTIFADFDHLGGQK